MSGHPPLPRTSLSRLKWLGIFGPLAFLTVLQVMLHSWFYELHHYPGVLFLFAILGVAVALFSFSVFAIVGKLERRIVEQNVELLQRNDELSALVAVGRAASRSLTLAAIADEALDAVLAVTSAESAEVWLADGEELVLSRQRGEELAAFRTHTRLPIGRGIPGLAAERREPVVSHDLPLEPQCPRAAIAAHGFTSSCALPLVSGDALVGVLGVASRRCSAFTSPEERRLLTGICEQLAVAIENARLHAQVLDHAVLEERERLARELHDGLAQMLAYVNAQTLAIRALVTDGRLDAAVVQLDEMELSAKEAYTDVRSAILGLRVGNDGFLPGVREYVRHFEQISETRAQLRIDPGVETLHIAPASEIQLVRIVEEALRNVRQHAQARRVEVRFSVADSVLRVEIADDGRGFRSERREPKGWPRFGLQTMRERAGAIGATLDVITAPGEGTRVIVLVPPAPGPVEAKEVPRAGAAR